MHATPEVIDRRFEELKAEAARSWSNLALAKSFVGLSVLVPKTRFMRGRFGTVTQTIRKSGNPTTILRAIERLHADVIAERSKA